MASTGGTLAGHYQPVADTAAQATSKPLRGKGYSWKCYPIPTSDVLNVELEGEVKELFVSDVTGKMLLRAVPAHHKATLQLGSFPTGVYFLQFFTGKKWEKTRFLVNR